MVKCSYLEIYNEAIMDLLDPKPHPMQLREDIKKGVYVDGLAEESVSSVKEMISLVGRGSRNRHTGAT